MQISQALYDAINQATVDVDGTAFPLHFLTAEVVPPEMGRHVDVTVETNRAGEPPQRATVGVGFDRLEDVDYMVKALPETMRRVITGELPPGQRELL